MLVSWGLEMMSDPEVGKNVFSRHGEIGQNGPFHNPNMVVKRPKSDFFRKIPNVTKCLQTSFSTILIMPRHPPRHLELPQGGFIDQILLPKNAF